MSDASPPERRGAEGPVRAAGFPFTAVVGAEDAKLALVLAALDPGIGGVLLRGEKGSAKTTLARGLAALLPGDAPFVDLPVGATEDRVVGSLDIAAALTGGQVRLRPGLLADAHGGVLYVDEVNLLPDHLVDALLDVAASGVNRVEREGVAHTHPARFVLVGSMNPEEGELRPQLLDRFGLAVDIRASAEAAERAEAVRRRLQFDREPGTFAAAWDGEELALAARLARAVAARPAALPADLAEQVSSLCVAVGAEGLRADLVICRAAAALARWEVRDEITAADVRRVAPLALAHRARRNPLDPHGLDAEQLDPALDQALGAAGPGDRGEAEDRVAEPDVTPVVARVEAAPERGRAVPPGGRRSVAEGPRGRLVGDRPPRDGGPTAVAVAATVREAAARGGGDGGRLAVEAGDVREAVREARAGNLVILAVDASGSMGAERRMEAAKGAVLGLLLDAYQRRDRVALVTFRGEGADVALRPTGSVEVARARLAGLPTGGRTPLAAGILAALELAQDRAGGHQPLLVLITDGRATWDPEGSDPVDAARRAAAAVRRRKVPAVVVDVEEGPHRLALAAELAEVMGARHVTLSELTGSTVVSAVRAAAAG